MSIEVKKNSQIFLDSNVLRPENEQAVSDIVRENYKKNLPLEIVGSNTKKFIGYNLQTEKILNFSKLNGIIEYLPEELYIKVKAGTPLNLIEETLEKKNQQLAFETIDLGFISEGRSNKGTVGGYISCNFAGSRRFKIGSVRDHILGFRGVNGKGDIIKSGGTVVKNVTGYDLSKLISGSNLMSVGELKYKIFLLRALRIKKILTTETDKPIFFKIFACRAPIEPKPIIAAFILLQKHLDGL